MAVPPYKTKLKVAESDMKRRSIELVLLCIAAVLVVLMFAMIAIDQNQGLSLTTLGIPLGLFVSFIIAHLAVRKFVPGADPALLPIVFALSGIGIAFVTRLRPELAMNQVLWLFLGIVFMILVLAFVKNIDKLASYKYTLMIIGVVLLLSPLLPFIGQEIYGSRIWLSLGPFSFQPGEVAKIFMVLFLAGYLATNREMLSVFTHRVGPFSLPDFRTLLPMLVMWLIALLIVIFEKDLGSAIVFFSVFLAMVYVATGKKLYVIIGLILALVGGFAAWTLFSHVQIRVTTWLDPFADAANTGYQLVQSLFSMADGGLFGVGIGRGLVENIPVVESDFIFAAIAEETGLLGAGGLLLLYLCFAVRGFATASRAKSDVSSLIAVGMTSVIVLQAFIIVGGVTRLFPLTGLTLPFVSQGGSSLLASLIAVGFLLRCGDEGTGVESEVKTGTTSFDPNSVLGRIALGKRLTKTMVVFSLLFALLIANLTVIMVVQADYYRSLPNNNHTIEREARSERGTISTYDNVVLAKSVRASSGTYERVYPSGDLASHIVGYYSSRYGSSGIELKYSNALKGEASFSSWSDVLYSSAGVSIPGNDVRLTINSQIQQAAEDSLDGYNGACIVVDPRTGAVLALASSPSYSPSDIDDILSSSSSSSSLLNRATQSLYAPGSTFKMLSLSTALDNNVAQENTVFSSPGEIEIGGGLVSNYDKANYGNITLARATEVSSNTAFGQLGTLIGAQTLVSSAEKYGFNKAIDIDLPTAISLMPKVSEMTTWETAWAAVGQPVGQHSSPAGPQATVIQMAMIGCAIANGGIIQTPYFVDSIYGANGTKSYSATPTQFAQVMSSSTASRVRKVLEGVVNSGTGAGAAINGVQVAGKTGTAETGKAVDDSWFVGMAPSDNPTVVIAIVTEQGAGGNGDATARAQNVLRVALQVQGLL